MTGKNIYISLAFAIALALPMIIVPSAYALRAEVAPGAITQGDPFVVTLTSEEAEEASETPGGAFNGNTLEFAPCGEGCWQAIGAVALDAKPGSFEVKVKSGEEVLAVPVEIIKGNFLRQSLTLSPDKVNLSPEDEARTDREAAMLMELWQIRTPKLWQGEFIMPLGHEYSTEFGVRRTINKTRLSIHKGVDIRGAMGEPVKAANTGVVVLTDDLFYGGNTLVMDHGQGIYTVYMHMSEFVARKGQVVEKGETVGLVGSTGRSTGPHLHYTLKVHSLSANPTAITMLPLGERHEITVAADKAVGDKEEEQSY